MDLNRELKLAIDAAREAGTYLGANQSPTINSVDGRDIKLKEDVEAERIILNILKDSHPILSEESGLINFAGDVYQGLHWIVDPLDGTYNYSSGFPLSCVSIALWDDQEPLLGVIYDFHRSNLYYSFREQRGWNNPQHLRTSQVFDPGQACLATGFPVNFDFDRSNTDKFLEFLKQFKKIRMIGSAAYSLVCVASGQFDLYAEQDIMRWDVAAGLALVQAAGGAYKIQPGRKDHSLNVVAGGSELVKKVSDDFFMEMK